MLITLWAEHRMTHMVMSEIQFEINQSVGRFMVSAQEHMHSKHKIIHVIHEGGLLTLGL